MPVSDYDTNPDKNTAISGINIAEGCPPGNVNDAIRQMMADVKALSVDGGSGPALPDATTTTKGVVMLAETADTTSTTKSATPAGVKATVDAALSGNAALANAVAKTRKINTTAPLTGGGDLSADRTLAVSAATTSAAGVVQLATAAEAASGTDTGKAVTPAALKSALSAVEGGAATPKAASGVGQWGKASSLCTITHTYIGGTVPSRYSGVIELPEGGTWAYFFECQHAKYRSDPVGQTYISQQCGVKAGGTVLVSRDDVEGQSLGISYGFCWRVA